MGGIQKKEVKRFKTSFSQGNNYEKGIFNPISPPSPLPCPDAVWVLPTGSVCGDGSVRSDGIQILRREKNVLAIMFGTLALLFQPFVKVALGRTMWNVVDVAVAILLIVLWRKEGEIE